MIIREPGNSELWPNTVKVTVNSEAHEKFLEKLLKIRALYFVDNMYDFDETSSASFVLKKDLAIEGLTKLFYDDNFELGEKITYCSYHEIIRNLNLAGFEIYETDAFDSESMYENFRSFGVKVTDPETDLLLPFPKCFTYTVAGKDLDFG